MFAIALDGPAGAGKSTVAKLTAKRLQMHYVDTGAIYRTLGLALYRLGVDLEDEKAVEAALPSLDVAIRYQNDVQHMTVNGEDLTKQIRTQEVGTMASVTAVYGCVRDKLLSCQRTLAEQYEVIMDGRDIGTVVLPDAELKIYLTADVRERAMRRFLELEAKNPGTNSLEEIEKQVRERDERDMNRAIAPLRKADDAVEIDTTHMSAEEAANRIAELAEKRKYAD
ncbi:MAG: (d)CMP kinase [Firmicutes bacterium]|nr:(d)CMP kinase [Bacillota bacterium]